jgi:hypothetical protein
MVQLQRELQKTLNAFKEMDDFAVGCNASEEVKLNALASYKEIFSSTDTLDVRLRNKALALKKAKLVGMALENKFAVFESKKQYVAVHAEALNKKTASKVSQQFEAAADLFRETGIPFDGILKFPDSGELRTVGLGNRERITMILFDKTNVNSKKSD